jgi:hypothetical protein
MRSQYFLAALVSLTSIACGSSNGQTATPPIGSGSNGTGAGGSSTALSDASVSASCETCDAGSTNSEVPPSTVSPTGTDAGSTTASNYDGGPVWAPCGSTDNPETGIQGDKYPGTVNCGITLLSAIPSAGVAGGAGHCAYVRLPGTAAYTGSVIKAYSIADPMNPVQTDQVACIGGSESMRVKTVPGRSILVDGRAVYDVSNCEKFVKKGEIQWPSQNAINGLYVAALSSHELAISHDTKSVYTGLGFAIGHIDDLDHAETWTVSDWHCEMNLQSGFSSGNNPAECAGPAPHSDDGRQYSHSSDDNLEDNVWFGGNQNGDGFSQMEPPTTRMVDISDPKSIKILDTVHNVPGHSMNWWRTPFGRDYIIAANEGPSGEDSCQAYPRPTNLGDNLEAYVVEVTGNKFGTPSVLTLDINRPENCQHTKATGENPGISETSIYNNNGAAFVMIEYGAAGLRLWDIRNGDHPKEIAYWNDGNGHTHSGQFYYDDTRGLIIASGALATQVLMLEPQMIQALGLPRPTDPKYPFK